MPNWNKAQCTIFESSSRGIACFLSEYDACFYEDGTVRTSSSGGLHSRNITWGTWRFHPENHRRIQVRLYGGGWYDVNDHFRSAIYRLNSEIANRELLNAEN